MGDPLGRLKYLYTACGDYARDRKHYLEVLGAMLAWEFHAFGAHVGAFRLADGPLVLLADHRKPPNVMPVFAVDDLEATVRDLKGRGWVPEAGPFGIPDGPCYTFRDPSGNEFAVFGNERPDALLHEYQAEHGTTGRKVEGRRRSSPKK
jgi:predicted enzyme related to lactoylglutathione lyase